MKQPINTEKILSNVLSCMRQRCYNVNHTAYRYYGEKGVGICIEWLRDKSEFIRWALWNGWSPGLTIDRIDSSKSFRGYSPENCRFVTQAENCRNIRREHKA